MAGENVAVLVLAALLVGLLIGHALGRRQGLVVNHVGLPQDAAHAGMGDATDAGAMPSASDEDSALAASAPPAPKSVEEARAMVAQMGSVPADELISLGNRKFDNGKWLLAIAFYEGALKQQADLPDVWCDLGAAYHAAGENDEALRCFDETLKRQPEHLQAWFNRGVVYAATGRKAEARAAYQKVIAVRPEDPLAQDARAALESLR